jgi:hypothetical protein
VGVAITAMVVERYGSTLAIAGCTVPLLLLAWLFARLRSAHVH